MVSGSAFIKNTPSTFSINRTLTLPPEVLDVLFPGGTTLYPSGARDCVALGKSPLFRASVSSSVKHG